MDDPKAQVVAELKDADHVLVTVSSNPSVDQLSAAIGLTIFLNKLNKHCTAVFSGAVPSKLDFLKPDRTIEKNTDSLRDFIISLDKSKADKLRYKVEDEHVKIFITPYRTSISDKDLNFEQGDFNVEAVVALGVHDQKDLDAAITSHGRILHDASVMSVTTDGSGDLGSINWVNPDASSLCEMVVSLTDELKHDFLDAQIATAFLTGIVAETERFSNDKTSSDTMSISAKLMAAGANQQLIASELDKKPEPEVVVEEPDETDEGLAQNSDIEEDDEEIVSEDGTLKIGHEYDVYQDEPIEKALELPEVDRSSDSFPVAVSEDDQQIQIDDQGSLETQPTQEDALLPVADERFDDASIKQDEHHRIISKPRIMSAPPAASVLDPSIDPSEQGVADLSNVPASGDNEVPTILTHDVTPLESQDAPIAAPEPPAPEPPKTPQEVPDTLADIERAVGSPHATQQVDGVPEGLLPLEDEIVDAQPAVQDISDARSAVDDATRPNPSFTEATAAGPSHNDTAVGQLPQFDLSQISQPGLTPPVAPQVQAPPAVPPPIQAPTVPANSRPQMAVADQQRAQPQTPQRADYGNPFDLPPI